MSAAHRGAAVRSGAGRWARCAVAVLAAVAGICAVGCASTDTDMPWNTPQSWEGSPYLPGLSDRN